MLEQRQHAGQRQSIQQDDPDNNIIQETKVRSLIYGPFFIEI